MRRTMALALVLALLAACSSDGPTPAERADERARDRNERRSERADKDGPGSGAKEKKERKGSRSKKGDDNEELPGSDLPGSEDPPELSIRGDGGPRFARLSATAEEPEPDSERQGPLIPDYAEATELAVRGLGKNIRFTWKFAGALPHQMPDRNTVMVLGLGISGKKKNDGYALGAQATHEGWNAYSGYKNETRRFPGTFFVTGDQVEMTVPWKALGGPRPFEWFASANWFNQTGNTTSYSFDEIPNGRGIYPD